MSQEEALGNVSRHIKSIADEATLNKVYGHIDKFEETFDPSQAVKVGDQFPKFRLGDATGNEVSSTELLRSGPLLITFYRGEWCPYCNIAVQYLQRHLDDFTARGVSLVAISPELPDYSLSATEKNSLKFPVLTDLHNQLARTLGIVYDQSCARELHGKIGVDLNARNGEDTWEVPIPATILVDTSGVVRAVHIDVDFRKRLDPKVAIEWIDEMQKA